MDINTPNIFSYATSELSQDAFLLWLLDWANPKYCSHDAELHRAAQAFVRLLLERPNLEVVSVKCYKQENHIDVFAIVNENYALIIEDKTNTSEHSNQLKRYSEWVKGKYNDLELHCVYYKTGNESLYKLRRLATTYQNQFPEEYFMVIGRAEILGTLSQFNINNSIFNDYIDYIQHVENETNKYLTLPVKHWNSRAWQGFYLRLEQVLGEGDWGYVSNPSGGFWGFWWTWVPIPFDNSIELYLQFEQDSDSSPRLCVKAYSKGESRPELYWSDAIIKASKEYGVPLERPSKRKIGKTMTLAVIKDSFLPKDRVIDIDNIVKILKCLKDILPTAAAAIK